MAATRPGRFEYEIESVLIEQFLRGGSTGPGYTPIVAAGDNANVLHYVRNRDPMRDGELMEASASTVHVVRDGVLLTPHNSMRILPGTSRSVVEELAADLPRHPLCLATAGNGTAQLRLRHRCDHRL